MNKAPLEVFALMVVKVLGPQFAVGFLSGEQMVDGNEHGVPNGDHRATFTPARGDAAELGGEVGALRPAGDVGDLGEGAP